MKDNKGINFFFLIIAIITGAALYKKFNFETLQFEKPALAIIYFIAFAVSIYFLIKEYKNRLTKQKLFAVNCKLIDISNQQLATHSTTHKTTDSSEKKLKFDV